jgi:hypothetical protein
MRETEAWWNDLWLATFTPGVTAGGNTSMGVSDVMFATVVRWFVALSTLFWVIKFIKEAGKMMELNLSSIIQIIVPTLFLVVVIVLMLQNNAALARAVPLGMRANINGWRDALMSAQVTDLTIRDALNDVLLTDMSQMRIMSDAVACEKLVPRGVLLPSPTRPTDPKEFAKLSPAQVQAYDFMDCMKKLSETAMSQLRRSEAQNCGGTYFGPNEISLATTCRSFKRFSNATEESLKAVVTTEQSKIDNGKDYNKFALSTGFVDYLAGVSTASTYRPALDASQWLFISMMELGLWIDALIAPIAIALSLIPGRLNMTVAWLISFLTIGLAQIVYTVIIGSVALQLSQDKTLLFTDMRLPMALGLFGPAVALAVIGGGGFAATKAFTSSSVGLVTTAASIGAGAFGGVTAAIARTAHIRR